MRLPRPRFPVRRLAGLLVVASSIALFAAGFAWLRGPRLLDRATRIGRIGPEPGYEEYWTRAQFWLSGREMLTFVREDQDQDRVGDGDGWSIRRLDVPTGKATALGSLTRLFNRGPAVGRRFGRPIASWDLEVAVSPDGHRVLWRDRKSDESGRIAASYHVAMLDGSHHVEWPGGFPTQETWTPSEARSVPVSTVAPPWGHVGLFWASDSRHWVVFEPEPGPGTTFTYARAIVRDVAAPGYLEVVPISPRDPVRLPDHGVYPVGYLHKVISKDQMLWHESPGPMPPGPRALKWVEWGPGGAGSSLRRHSLPLPAGVQPEAMTYSPSGDRLAWVLADMREASWSARLRREFPALGLAPSPEPAERLWVGRRDGSGVRVVGRVPISPGPTSPRIGDLRWVDDRHLGFAHDGVAYTIPAA